MRRPRTALLVALAALLCVANAAPLRVSLRQVIQLPIPDAQPDDVLIPAGPSPPPSPPPPPTTQPPTTLPPPTLPPTTAVTDTTTQPQTTTPQAPSPTPTGSVDPEVSPGAQAGGPITGGANASGDNVEGDSEGTPAALIGGLVGGFFALLLLIVFIILAVLRRREPQQPTGEYAAAEAGVDSQGGEVVADPSAFHKDQARDLGPAIPPTTGGDEPVVALPPVVATASSSDEGAAPIKRGPTPPPHDYVLGAGPAATRTDFIDLRTKFERDEIGDNSAVLGVADAQQLPPTVEQRTIESADVAEVGTATEPVVPLPPVAPEPPVEAQAPSPELPDREGDTVPPVTFDAQERMVAGGEGSGAISDAPQASGPASIAEESGDMPSLERDPISTTDNAQR